MQLLVLEAWVLMTSVVVAPPHTAPWRISYPRVGVVKCRECNWVGTSSSCFRRCSSVSRITSSDTPRSPKVAGTSDIISTPL